MKVFDIESAPLDDAFTRDLEPQLHPFPPFDESKVALGNRVNPDAIHAAKEAAKQRWERERQDHSHAHLKAVCDWEDAKTLSPLLSRVLAIGWYGHAGDRGKIDDREIRVLIVHHEAEEAAVLKEFWAQNWNSDLAGWNIQGFDIPFLVERSQILGVECPAFSTPLWKCSRVIDLMQEWNRKGDARKLDQVAGRCGFPRKLDLGTITRRDGTIRKALPHERPDLLEAYTRRDVEIEAFVAHRLFPNRVLRPWEPEPALPF